MSFIGNSSQIKTTIKKGNLQEFKAKQACKAEIGEYATTNQLNNCIEKKLSGKSVKNYDELILAQKDAAPGVSVASQQEWIDAWKEKQTNIQKKNIPKEDPSSPIPLIMDKVAGLPATSTRRRFLENFANTLNDSATNEDMGFDSLNRDSYKETKRIVKNSRMLHDVASVGPETNLPSASTLLGSEEGRSVSNLQSWKPYIANAVRPISDAMGSHSDTNHGVIKDSTGTAAFFPLASVAAADHVGTHIVNEAEGAFKISQMEILQHLPSKAAGSIRHVATTLDSILSMPFDILCDVYGGLMALIQEIANLLDMALTMVVDWVMDKIGGLLDSIFPEGMMEDLLQPIQDFCNELGDLFDMLSAFPAVNFIKDILGSITTDLVGLLGGVANLMNILSSGNAAASYVGGLAGSNFGCTDEQLGLDKLAKFGSNIAKTIGTIQVIQGVFGALSGVKQGLGNLGAMITKVIPGNIGNFFKNIRNLGSIIAGLLPAGIGYIFDSLMGKICNIGRVGNVGFSVGKTMDFLGDSAFSKAMRKFASHSLVVGPLFGKTTVNTNFYARENVIGSFENSRFVSGAQGNKGVTIIGVGATSFQRPFGIAQNRAFNSRMYKSASDPTVLKSIANQQIKQGLVSAIFSNNTFTEQSQIIDESARGLRNVAFRAGQNYVDKFLNR